MVEICLLGSGGGMPMPFRYLSATVINFKGRKILIDCGEGTQVSMRMLGWGFKTVDVICITHTHGDHIVGLPGLLSTIGNSGRIIPLTIIGPEGITEVVNGLRVIAKFLPYEINIIENPEVVDFHVNKDGVYVKTEVLRKNQGEIVELENKGHLVINTMEVEHSTNCLGYSFYFKRERKFNVESALDNDVPKVLWSKLQKSDSVVFEDREYTSDMVLGSERRGIKVTLVTDSRPTTRIPNFIKHSDLFICEGTYGDDADMEKAIKNKHMTFREAATMAKAGEVKELLLTHFSPAMTQPNEFIDNAKNEFSNTTLGEDRMVKTLCYTD